MGLFNKFSESFSSETLGKIEGEKIPKPQKVVPKQVHPQNRPQKDIPQKVPQKEPVKKAQPMMKGKKSFSVPDTPKAPKQIEMFVEQQPPPIVTNVKKKYPVLELLGIDFEPNVNNLVLPNDIEEVTFDLTAPTGLSPEQVEQFLDKVQSDLIIYLSIIESRQQDFVKLLEQISVLEEKLVERSQEQELANYIVDNEAGNVDKLKNQLLELRLENEELKKKLGSRNNNSSIIPNFGR